MTEWISRRLSQVLRQRLDETPVLLLEGPRKLRERLGTAFAAGIAFHLGQVGYEAEDRLHSVPVERLWI